MKTSHQILLVEDSKQVQLTVKSVLKNKYILKIADTTSAGLQELEQNSFSLIILDVHLPDGDGFKLCAQLKLQEKHRSTPVIFLSGKDQINDKVLGLSVGADDYIVKPFDLLEFQARVEARIRSVESARSSQDDVYVGSFHVNPGQQRIFIVEDSEERPIELTTLEFKLFYYLLRNEDIVLSREQILNEVWGHLPNVTDRTVDTHVYTLRQKLGTYASCIKSVQRVGYRYSQAKPTQAAA